MINDIYEDQETEQVITTYNKKIAEISFDKNVVTINGVEKTTYAHAIKKDDTVYLPISELKDVYDIEINNIESTKVLVIDSLSKEQKKAVLNSNQSVKSSKKFIAKTVDRVKKGECVIVISNENGYAKIRTEEGKIGHILQLLSRAHSKYACPLSPTFSTNFPFLSILKNDGETTFTPSIFVSVLSGAFATCE